MKAQNPTILVVEDSPEDRILIARAFRKAGVKDAIYCAEDGIDAINYMKGEGKYSDRRAYQYPTLIMTDLKMPKADGFMVLQHLKMHPEWKVIPTVVLSASADPDDIRRAYESGASCYHVKPSTFEALTGQLELLHRYWMTCEVPEVDAGGKQLRTHGKGKLGEKLWR